MNTKALEAQVAQMGQAVEVFRQQRDVAEGAVQALQLQVENLQMELITAREQRDQMADKLRIQKRETHWQRLNDMIAAQVPYSIATQKNICERLGF